MKLLKKAAAFLIAAVISVSSASLAFAADDYGDENNKNPDTIVDISDKLYIPIDKSKYVKWNGKDKLLDNTKYYVDSQLKVSSKNSIVLPESSELVLCGGANLQIYTGTTIFVRGKFVVAPEARLVVSGIFNLKETGGFESYGSVVTSKRSQVRISSDYVIHGNSSAVYSGEVLVYISGNFINRGKTTISSSSGFTVTGNFTNTQEGFFHNKGNMSITLSGTTTQAGYFSLTGEVVNSGIFVFEKTVNYHKGKTAKFAESKSGRVLDYRDGKKPSDGTVTPAEIELKDTGIKGIDVSSWQETVDWKKVKAAGVDFAMVRASFSTKTDKTFAYNVVEAEKAGVAVGAYHYCYALTVAEARKEAKHFIKTIKPYKIEYPVVLDLEDESQKNLDPALLKKIAKTFIDEVKKAGYYPMIYSYTRWYEDFMDPSDLGCEVWVAHWGVPKPGYTGTYGIWQYSSEGIVSGIDGYVDLDVGFKDYKKIIREGGYNNLSKFD